MRALALRLARLAYTNNMSCLNYSNVQNIPIILPWVTHAKFIVPAIELMKVDRSKQKA